MSTPPTRCCVQTQKGTRCANEPSPVRPSRMIGPVRLAACGLEAHQRALWSLPGFIRHDAYCGAFGCDRPSNAGICPKHRDQYRDFGITEHMLLAQEAPMTEPAPMPPAAPQEAADGGATPSPEAVAGSIDWRALRVQWQIRVRIGLVYDITSLKFVSESLANGRVTGSDEAHAVCDGAEVAPWMPIGSAAVLAARMVAVHAALTTPKPESGPACTAIDGKPCVCYAREGDCPHMPGSVDYTSGTLDRATAPPATVEEFLRDLESGDGEPSEGDVADAPMFMGGTDTAPAELMARWGYKQDVPLDGLAALAARGQEPIAPGPTVAELQAELAQERERADAAQHQLREAVAELAAIAALLDPEDSPTHDADDQPIPLPTRVQTALMPDPAYERELRKSLHAVEAELFEVDRALQHLGAYGNGPTKERLLQVLTPEDRRAILEVDAAEARMDLARLRARRLNPAPPERVAELVAKVAALDARIAALDAERVQR